MKKLNALFLLILLSTMAYGQNWQNVSNSLQRKIVVADTLYRFNMGAPGFWNISDKFGQYYTKVQSDARYALAGAAGVSSFNGRTGAITPLVGDYSGFYPVLTGSYVNPSWITSLPWSKITSTPTTLSGYGITDGVTLNTFQTITAAKTFTGVVSMNGIRLLGASTAFLEQESVSILPVSTRYSTFWDSDGNYAFNKTGQNSNQSKFSFNPTATRTYTWPDASGTVALTSDIPAAGNYIQNQTASPQIAAFYLQGQSRLKNSGNTTALTIDNGGGQEGFIINNTAGGIGQYIENDSGIGMYLYGTSGSNELLFLDNRNSDPALSIENNTVNGTGYALNYDKDGVNKARIDNAGNISGQSFIKAGGTSSQFLKADGSADTLTESDIPSLSISKVTGLADSLTNKFSKSDANARFIQNRPLLYNPANDELLTPAQTGAFNVNGHSRIGTGNKVYRKDAGLEVWGPNVIGISMVDDTWPISSSTESAIVWGGWHGNGSGGIFKRASMSSILTDTSHTTGYSRTRLNVTYADGVDLDKDYLSQVWYGKHGIRMFKDDVAGPGDSLLYVHGRIETSGYIKPERFRMGTDTPVGKFDSRINGNQESTWFFRNTDTTNSVSRAVIHLEAGDNTTVIKSLHGEYTYFQSARDIIFQPGTSTYALTLSSSDYSATIGNLTDGLVSSSSGKLVNTTSLPAGTTASTLNASGSVNVATSSGNLGVGTVSPNNTSAGRTVLDVNGSSSALYDLSVGGVAKGQIYHDGTDMYLSNLNNGSLSLRTNNTTAVTIASNQVATFAATPILAAVPPTNSAPDYLLGRNGTTGEVQKILISNAIAGDDLNPVTGDAVFVALATKLNASKIRSGTIAYSGTANSTFTISFGGGALSGTNYRVSLTPTDATTAPLNFYVNNKTTTTFDLVLTAPATAINYDYFLIQD